MGTSTKDDKAVSKIWRQHFVNIMLSSYFKKI